MITSLRLDRIPEGGLALYDLPPATRAGDDLVQVLSSTGDGDVRLHHVRRSGRVAVPTNRFAGNDLHDHVRGLVEVARATGWASATLLFPTHEPALLRLDDGSTTRHVVCGLALLQGNDAADDTEPVEDTDDALALLDEWVEGTHGRDLAAVHPAVRSGLLRQMQDREARSLALARSKDLLLSCLSPEQRLSFEHDESFLVTLPDHGTFRIRAGHAHNIQLLSPDDGEPDVCFCVVTTTWVPVYDQVLAQKLLLELDTDRFFQLANRSVLRSRPGRTATRETAA